MSLRLHASDDTTRSLLVYGSLMDRCEWVRWGVAGRTRLPVVVAGLRREFSQEPSWRRGAGSARGVLTVRRLAGSHINAVLVKDVPTAMLDELDRREQGYFRRPVSMDDVIPFGWERLPGTHQEAFIYEGKPERHNPSLTPLPTYLEQCVRAALTWGDAFRSMFLQTTFVAGGVLDPAHG